MGERGEREERGTGRGGKATGGKRWMRPDSVPSLPSPYERGGMEEREERGEAEEAVSGLFPLFRLFSLFH